MKRHYKLLSLLLVAALLTGAVFIMTGCQATASPAAPTVTAQASAASSPTPEKEPPEQQTSEPEHTQPPEQPPEPTQASEPETLDEHGSYTTKEDVALFIHIYGHLPDNFVTKKQAEDAGWTGGSLEKYMPGMCIGGSRFGNYEGLLPKAKGRTWTECDINTLGKSSRGAERIVFSNDGLIYYTSDHYESFEQLY